MRKLKMKSPGLVVFVMCAFCAGSIAADAQQEPGTLPPTRLLLNDLSAFRPVSPNWKIVGNVFADLNTEQAMSALPGRGILVNLSDQKNRGHLFTKFEHGDLEIEMDVMMPRGSNSGIYLQGRYEVQLFDSWGKSSVTYGDMGGIYQRTDTATNKGYEGSAPGVNASRAPGLWQRLKIIFKAPDFDPDGKKISNARFVKVYLNGVVVQDDVEVTGPTRSGAFQDEKPVGPLMIQGNHGRVAFRNITYKLYDRKKVGIKDLLMLEFKTPGESMKGLSSLKPIREMEVDSISRHLAGQQDVFLLMFRGGIEFPKAGTYLFKMQTGGGGILVIDGDTILRHDGAHGFDQAVFSRYNARRGSVAFTLIYNKPIQWRQGFALFVEGPGMEIHPLHAKGSVFVEPEVEPILIHAEGKMAVIQRSFMDFAEGKKTHCLSVGTSEGIHYTVNLEDGSIFQLWDGDFLDATPMWHRRGNQQIGIPLGPVIQLADDPGFAPAYQGTSPLKFLEYTLDDAGYPEMLYAGGDIKLFDKLIPASGRRGLTRTVRIDGRDAFHYNLASGSVIEVMSDGSFAVNDKEYYLTVDTPGLKPEVRKLGNHQTIVITGNGAESREFEYTLFW